jgi:hypothetical protein
MSVPAGKVPIFECVKEGFLFLGRDWRGIIPIAVIGGLALTPVQVWAESGQARGDLGVMLLATLASLVVQAPFLAAFLRRAISRGEQPLAVKFGRDELNLIGAGVSLSFFYLILVFVAVFVIAIAVVAMTVSSGFDAAAAQTLPPDELAAQLTAALGGDGVAILLALLALIAGFFLWLAARLALVYPATIGDGAMRVFSTWTWTRNNGLRIMAVLIVLVLLAAFVSGIVLALPLGLIEGMVGERMSEVGTVGHAVTTFIAAAVSMGLVVAPITAMSAYLYRGLRPAEGVIGKA